MGWDERGRINRRSLGSVRELDAEISSPTPTRRMAGKLRGTPEDPMWNVSKNP
ncbi:hypothetical protein [Pasteuria penetrans]|uniref:hypothetical protein n=1 Tax=Pasteuria penetrans TaxID=86005 RepID=UPI00165A5E9B|nr:hypothetical protein [Pasteuria penetrans]